MPRPILIPPNYGAPRNIVFKEAHRRLDPGSFCRIRKKKDGDPYCDGWVFCREYFHDESAQVREMLFVCHRNKGRNVAQFIHDVEEKLDVNPRTRFAPTQRNNILWMRCSSWWTNTSMKRSLFTMLLRAGNHYNLSGRNFERALFSIDYTKDTEYAVRRFLSGYTKYTGKVRGWHNEFKWGGGSYLDRRTPSNAKVRELLIKPPK